MADKKYHILLVDDDESVIEVLRAYLEKKGNRVTTLSDGSKVIAAVQENEPDIIFLDYRMSTSGREVLHSLKKEGITVPVIIMSAYKSKADGFDLRRRGAKTLIVKPFEFDEVDAALETFLPSS